jgi:hypothetical protein
MELVDNTEYTTENLTQIIKDNYGIPIKIIDGIIKETGKYKNKENNQIFIVDDNNWYMFCQPNIITKFCKISYEKIIEFEKSKNDNNKIYWGYNKNFYIFGKTLDKILYLHQVIMNYYGNGRGTGGNDTEICSIDHINRNRLDNSYNNLRIATRKEQEQNSKGIMDGTKRERRQDACELPDDLTQEMMPKYVTFNKNVWNKEKNKVRYFFRIEHHPLLGDKVWESSKSMNVTNEEKLNKTIEILDGLDNGILPKPKIRDMPKYTYFAEKDNGKYKLVYDNRDNNLTKVMTIQEESFDITNVNDIQKQLYIFNRIIVSTFEEENSLFDDNYEYTGDFIDESEYYKLPKYVTTCKDRESNILCYAKKLDSDKTINKKITLRDEYDKLSDNEKNEELIRLNNELIKKYNKEYDFMDLTDEEHKKIEYENTFELPTYIRIAESPIDGNLYMYFSKGKGKMRLSKSMKLLKNYNLSKELLRFHAILKVFGEEYTFQLPEHVKNYREDPIILPDNIFINDQCDKPYIFEIKDETTYYMYLPEKYEISEVVEEFISGEPIQEIKLNTEQQKERNILKNISISKKGKYMILCYQNKQNNLKFNEYITLPDKEYD